MKKTKMKTTFSVLNSLIFLLIFLGLISDLTGKAKGESIFARRHEELQRSPAEEKIALFSQAFINFDLAGLERFFEQCLTKEKLKLVPAKERALRLIDLRKRLGNIVSVKMDNSSLNEFSLFYQGEKEGLIINFKFKSDEEKVNLVSMMVEEAASEGFLSPSVSLPLDQAIREIDSRIGEISAQEKFSGVVLIARDFKPIYFKAWGLASREFAVPNQLNTKFNLGSINKIFTKIAIAQLAERGLLSLDDPLGKFLPDYPNSEAREKVKIRHLVGMTSGIGDFFGPDFEKTPKDFIRHNRDYFIFFASKPLAFEPGSKQMYSNGSYVVLGEIISRASGQDYYRFIQENIFDVAGMKDSAWYEADEPVSNLAEGYTRRISGQQEAASINKGEISSKENWKKGQERGNQNKNFSVSGREKAGLIESKDRFLTQGFAGNRGERNIVWRKNIYTRPARGSAAGGGYSTAEDLLKFIQALYNFKFNSPPWTDWVFGGPEPKDKSRKGLSNQDRKKWNIALAGGAPGINASLEFDAESGWTIIVLANIDPPAATEVSRLIRSYLPKGEK